MRRVLLFCTAVALAALMVVVPAPDRANAAIPPLSSGVPSPVNILPSVVQGAVNAPAQASKIALLMAAWSKTPAFWDAVRAGSSATPAQTSALAAGRAAFKLPAFPVGSLVKVLGPVSTVATGAQMGLMVGNGASRLLGFTDNMVCAGASNGILQSVAAITNGVDCNGWQMTQDAIANANNDAVAGLIGQVICDPADASRCLQFLGFGNMDSNGQQRGTCFKLDGPNTGTNLFMRVNDNPGQPYYLGGESYSQMKSYFTRGNCNGIAGANGDRLLYDWPGVIVQDITAYTFDPTYVGGDTIEVGTADPERFLRCTVRLVGGGTLSALSAGFHESDGAYAPIICPELPDGGAVEGWDIDLIGGPEELRLLSEDATPEYTEFNETYAECGDGTCMLDLQKSSVSCFSNPVPCADWFADPDKEATYQCRYGEHAVALSECSVYAPTFKPGAVQTGETYGDPATGQPASQPTSVPGDSGAFSTPVQNPEQPRQCFPTGWGVLNPVEWVVRPVGCAIEWAFVPRPTVVQGYITGVETAWADTIVTDVAPIVAQFAAVPIMTGCEGVPIDVDLTWPIDWSMHWNFGEACEQPMAGTAALVRGVSGAVVLGYSILALTRYVGGLIGFKGFGAGE